MFAWNIQVLKIKGITIFIVTCNIQALASRGPRIVAQIVLLFAFLNFFGLPAIERFLKKEVMIVESMKQTDGIPSPAITFSVPKQIMKHSCFDRNESTEECLEKACLKQTDVIKSVTIGSLLKKEVNITREIVSKNFAYTWAGIYFTLSLPFQLGTDIKDKLYFGLNTNLSYLVFIHDQRYFLFNNNPTTIPGAHRAFDTNEMKPKSWQYRFELAEVNKLNLPSSPCNDDPTYNFLSCVMKSVASKVQKNIKSVLSFKTSNNQA